MFSNASFFLYFRFRRLEQAHRGTDDAFNTLFHFVLKHLEQPKAYARVPFLGFSSAFNTSQPHVLLGKMKAMKVNAFVIKRYHFFLTSRSQLVQVNQTHSLSLTTKTVSWLVLRAQATTKDYIRAENKLQPILVIHSTSHYTTSIFFSNHNPNHIHNFGTQTQKNSNTCFGAHS